MIRKAQKIIFLIFLPELAGEIQLKKYGNLLGDYSHKLHQLSDALGQCIDLSWDHSLDPLSLVIEPFESSSLFKVTLCL
jgi:hypothetical protein